MTCDLLLLIVLVMISQVPSRMFINQAPSPSPWELYNNEPVSCTSSFQNSNVIDI